MIFIHNNQMFKTFPFYTSDYSFTISILPMEQYTLDYLEKIIKNYFRFYFPNNIKNIVAVIYC